MNIKIDELGRIVIPKGIRMRLDIKSLDELKIETTDDKIIITKNKNKLKEFIEELKYNEEINLKNNLDNVVTISYVIERLKEINNKQ